MNRVRFALGVALLIIGVLMFFYGYTVMQEYHTFAGQLARALSEQARAEYRSAFMISAFGLGLPLVGISTMILEAAKEERR